MRTDALGNPATLADDAQLAALDDFVLGFIASEARAVNVLAAAEQPGAHDVPLLQACAAAVHLFAEAPQAAGRAQPFLARAQAGAPQATSREQRFIAAIAAWAAGDMDRAIALHHEQSLLHPRDLASVKLGQYHCFNRGDAAGMLRMAQAAAPAAQDVAYLHGMLAFGFEQGHALAEAEASARRAMALCRKEPWAHHALAHVMLTQGRHAEGWDFLQSVSDTWVGLNSFMLTHNWWHQALFALALGRPDEALRLHDEHVWGVAPDYSQDQVNAVSLLARIELAGLDVGGRWQPLADRLASRTADQVLPFLDVQYLYGLARAGRPQAGVLMRNLERHAQASPQPVWREVALPLARGLLAHARGDKAGAAGAMAPVMPRLAEIGGSHAQRDLFLQIWRDAQAAGAGR